MGNGPCYTTVKTLYCYISVQHTVNYATGETSILTKLTNYCVICPVTYKFQLSQVIKKPR